MMIPSRQRLPRVRAVAAPRPWPAGYRAGLLILLVSWLLCGAVRPAFGQVDPLLPVKGVPPNVIVVFDTSFPMLKDAAGDYYDIKTYNRADDLPVATALGVSAPQYRRKYTGLQFEVIQNANSKYFATDIVAVPSTATGYATFWGSTRFEIARAGLAQAVGENPNLVRWGLLKLRQNGEAWRSVSSSSGCDRPVRITGNVVLAASTDLTPCSGGATNMFAIYAPSSNGANYNELTAPGDAIVYGVGSSNATANIQTVLTQTIGTGALIPAGQDQATFVDRPLYNALIDAKAHAAATMASDPSGLRSFRNTVIVLVTSGKDDGGSTYLSHATMSTLAGSFASVPNGSGTRRVPIVVVGVSPAAADEAELQSIASASGGVYFRATSAREVTRGVNYAVQMAFSHANDLENRRTSEYTFVSPIVGTVNLVGARTATGALLPDTDIQSQAGATAGVALPQRSNVMLTAGFGLPGFDGRLRAFRTFRPVLDSTKPTGWKFVQDGTRLWPDLDDRPELAGLARVPASADARNIYTYIPNGSGGGTMVAFTVSNSATLASHLGGADPATLVPFIRALPLGAIIGSTPAIMDPPSLDPPPDDDYGFADSVGTFAGAHKNRRSIIFFGANDGMIHAVDARTGYEVWAFIPYNLLPKLQTLMDGQSIERFDYFVDSSPKIAEVKLGGSWKTLLIVGQGYGGTFYQAMDVTEAGMGVAPDADGLSAVTSLLSRFDTPGESIDFAWAFPNYSSFDPNVRYTNATFGDLFPGGRVTFYGDLKATANSVEKRVGFTFSDPAVGTLTSDRSVTGVMTGSGYFPEVEDNLAGRGTSAPRAGHAFFLLNAATGLPIGNPGGGSCSGTGCYDVGDVSNGRKNAIQADVTASGDYGATAVSKAYVGDTDGKYWRFTFNSAGAITASALTDTGQPIFSSSALLFIGTSDKYLFFGTGSDMLSNVAPGGSGTFKLFGVKDGASSGTVVFSRALTPVSGLTSACPLNGERPSSSPTVAGDIVFFATTTGWSSQPCIDGQGKIYAFTYVGTSAYDTNNNHTMDTNESPVVATSVGRASAPFIVDQHLFIGTSSSLGTGVTALGDAEDFNNGVGQVGVRILSWREIR